MDAVPRRRPAESRDKLDRSTGSLESRRNRGHSHDPEALPTGEFAGDIGVARRTRGMHHRDSHDVGQGRQASLPVVEPLALETRPNLVERAPHQALAQSLR